MAQTQPSNRSFWGLHFWTCHSTTCLPSNDANRRGAGASSRNHCFLDQTPLYLELQHPLHGAEAEQAANGVNLMVSLTQVTQDIPAP
jgi:hypothetical protein